MHRRIFIKIDGEFQYLKDAMLEDGFDCCLRGWLPKGWDPTRPQSLYLVYQPSDDPRSFFDEHRPPGFMEVLEGFRIVGDSPLVLIKNAATGEVTIPVPEYNCRFEAVRECEASPLPKLP